MNTEEQKLPSRLEEIVADFGYCVGREKLEYLLEFAQTMPPLPERFTNQKDGSHQVHECMTPVFVYAERSNGRMRFHFDVPEEAPTVRGYASLMQQGLKDVTPEAVLNIPDDFYLDMGLQKVISGQRLNGLSGILSHLKHLARQELEAEEADDSL